MAKSRSEERRVGKECRSRWTTDNSSRRRHTRWNCDWSSDVCSSDLFEPVFHLFNKKWLIIIAGLWEPQRTRQSRQIIANLDLVVAIYKRYDPILSAIFIGVPYG